MLKTLEATDNRIRLNLQLFADGEPGGEPQVDPRQSLINPLTTASSEPEPNQKSEQELEQELDQTPEDLKQFIKDGKLYGKFEKETDVIKAYGDLEKAFHNSGQEKAQLKQQLDNLQRLVDMQPKETPELVVSEPDQQTQSVIDRLSSMSEEDAGQWMETFYEKGPGALVDIIRDLNNEIESKYDSKLQEKIGELEPIKQQYLAQQQQQSINKQLEAIQQNADFETLKPLMAEIIGENQQQFDALARAAEENPEVNPYKVAYEMARGRQPQQGPTREQIEQELKQNLLNDADFKQQIIQGHMQTIKQQNNNLPNAVIGNQAAGGSPATPPNDIRTVSQGTKAFLSFLKGMGGN